MNVTIHWKFPFFIPLFLCCIIRQKRKLSETYVNDDGMIEKKPVFDFIISQRANWCVDSSWYSICWLTIKCRFNGEERRLPFQACYNFSWMWLLKSEFVYPKDLTSEFSRLNYVSKRTHIHTQCTHSDRTKVSPQNPMKCILRLSDSGFFYPYLCAMEKIPSRRMFDNNVNIR